jgi:hypothetical protein
MGRRKVFDEGIWPFWCYWIFLGVNLLEGIIYKKKGEILIDFGLIFILSIFRGAGIFFI